MQLGQAGPNFNDVATARGAAYKVFQIIDRVTIISHPPNNTHQLVDTKMSQEKSKTMPNRCKIFSGKQGVLWDLRK